MRKYESIELDFISWIDRDGKGVTELIEPPFSDLFELKSLSISNKTYVACCGMNHFIVKIKDVPEPKSLDKLIEEEIVYLRRSGLFENILKEICEGYYELKIKHEKQNSESNK